VPDQPEQIHLVEEEKPLLNRWLLSQLQLRLILRNFKELAARRYRRRRAFKVLDKLHAEAFSLEDKQLKQLCEHVHLELGHLHFCLRLQGQLHCESIVELGIAEHIFEYLFFQHDLELSFALRLLCLFQHTHLGTCLQKHVKMLDIVLEHLRVVVVDELSKALLIQGFILFEQFLHVFGLWEGLVSKVVFLLCLVWFSQGSRLLHLWLLGLLAVGLGRLGLVELLLCMWRGMWVQRCALDQVLTFNFFRPDFLLSSVVRLKLKEHLAHNETLVPLLKLTRGGPQVVN